MAGLLAARVLSDYFGQVTLVERDALPDRPSARKGVPQGRHVHVLLARGLQALERLFPSISDELRAAGAITVNVGRDIAWHHSGGWRTKYDADLRMLAMSRPLLEARVAERVRALPNVTLLEVERVAGVTADRGEVTGAQVRGYKHDYTIEADLVIDATGRGSAMPKWLEQLGYAAPATQTISVPLTYSTCLFPRSGRVPNWLALLITASGARRAGFAWAIEGDRWLVTLNSLFDEPAPADHAEFLSFAKSLPVPDLYDEICNVEPHSEPVRYRFPGSQWRRYRRLKSLPAGLVAIGDAVCSFNPVYGQGMTVATLEAETLGQLVSQAERNGELGPTFPQRWYGEIDRIIDPAWQSVAIEDFRHAETAGERPAALRPLQWYMDRVHRATHRSPSVTDQFYRVVGFIDPPTALFRPRIAADALIGASARRGS